MDRRSIHKMVIGDHKMRSKKRKITSKPSKRGDTVVKSSKRDARKKRRKELKDKPRQQQVGHLKGNLAKKRAEEEISRQLYSHATKRSGSLKAKSMSGKFYKSMNGKDRQPVCPIVRAHKGKGMHEINATQFYKSQDNINLFRTSLKANPLLKSTTKRHIRNQSLTNSDQKFKFTKKEPKEGDIAKSKRTKINSNQTLRTAKSLKSPSAIDIRDKLNKQKIMSTDEQKEYERASNKATLEIAVENVDQSVWVRWIKPAWNEINKLWKKLVILVTTSLYEDPVKQGISEASVRPQTKHFPGFAMASQLEPRRTIKTKIDKGKKPKSYTHFPEGVRYHNGRLAVGYRYRYRISNFLMTKEGEAWSKRENKSDPKKLKDLPKKDSLTHVVIKKPAVGYKYRYRISNYLKTLKPYEISNLKSEGYFKPLAFHTVPEIKIDSKLREDYGEDNKNSTIMAVYIWEAIKKYFSYQHCVEWITSENASPKSDKSPTRSLNPLYNKIGYEHRYRLSNKLKTEAIQKLKQSENHTDLYAKRKPKSVSYVYRYRVSNMLSALNVTHTEMVKHLDNDTWDEFRRSREMELRDRSSNYSINDDGSHAKVIGAPSNFDNVHISIEDIYPKELINVGYEYRYRRSRKMEALNISPAEIDKRRWQLIERKVKENTLNLILNKSVKQESKPISADGVIFTLDYSRLTASEKHVGYEFRYRISRKFQNHIPQYVLDDLKNESNGTSSHSISEIIEKIKVKQKEMPARQKQNVSKIHLTEKAPKTVINSSQIKELLSHFDMNVGATRAAVISMLSTGERKKPLDRVVNKNDANDTSIKHQIIPKHTTAEIPDHKTQMGSTGEQGKASKTVNNQYASTDKTSGVADKVNKSVDEIVNFTEHDFTTKRSKRVTKIDDLNQSKLKLKAKNSHKRDKHRKHKKRDSIKDNVNILDTPCKDLFSVE